MLAQFVLRSLSVFSKQLAFFFAAFLFAGCALERSLVFYPDPILISNPSDANLVYEDLKITTEDGVQINAWYVPFEGSDRVLLWFHGNAGNMSHRVDLLQKFHHALKINILLVDYRGYGLSEGEVTEAGTASDARSAYDFLLSRSDINPQQIFIFGRSLGAAVAIQLATESRTAGLILDAPFTSIKAMANRRFAWYPSSFLKNKFDSLSKIKLVKAPLLILHGEEDKVVPYLQGEKLFEAANEPKGLFTISGAGHNNNYLIAGPAYFETIASFIKRLR